MHRIHRTQLIGIDGHVTSASDEMRDGIGTSVVMTRARRGSSREVLHGVLHGRSHEGSPRRFPRGFLTTVLHDGYGSWRRFSRRFSAEVPTAVLCFSWAVSDEPSVEALGAGETPRSVTTGRSRRESARLWCSPPVGRAEARPRCSETVAEEPYKTVVKNRRANGVKKRVGTE
jgi:hypothetical protein